MGLRKFKYQRQIEELLAIGCQLPALYAPDNMHACRFVFSDANRQNHVPQYMTCPKRMLQDIASRKATTSFLSLSCFTTSAKAEAFFTNLQKAFRNVSASVGDSLAEGELGNDDGVKTATGTNGHFDFYEYEGCDLNNTFQITKKIYNDEGNKGI